MGRFLSPAAIAFVLLAGGSLASVLNAPPARCPSAVADSLVLDIPQQVPSQPSLDANYTWRFALCSPSRDSRCPTGVPAAYLLQSKTVANGTFECIASFDLQLQPWQTRSEANGKPREVFAAFTASVFAVGDRAAHVTFVCDPTATGKPVADGPVIVSKNVGVWAGAWRYAIRLNTSAVCASSPPAPTPPPAQQAACPTEVGSADWMIEQVVPSQPSWQETFTWGVSPCARTAFWACPSLEKGFATQYKSDHKQCIVAMTEQLAPWIVGSDNLGLRTLSAIFAGTFGQPNDRVLNITMHCAAGATGPGLVPDGAVYAYPASEFGPTAWRYEMNLWTSAACLNQTNAPAPTATPTPQPTNSGGCPAYALSNVSVRLPQVVPSDPGMNKDFQWNFQLCRPAVSAACPNAGGAMLFEEEVGAHAPGCAAAFTQWVSQWGPGYGGFNAVLANSFDDRIANVTIVCDPTAVVAIADGPVVATPVPDQQGKWHLAIRVNTSAAC